MNATSIRNGGYELVSRLAASGGRTDPNTIVPSPLGRADDLESARETFRQWAGGNFFRMLLASMRKSLPGRSLLNGGKAERIFTAHLDQAIVDRLAAARGGGFVDELFDQWKLRQQAPSTHSPTSGTNARGERPGASDLSVRAADHPGRAGDGADPQTAGAFEPRLL